MSESPRRPDEVRALARLAGKESRAATTGVERVHRAIAARTFRFLGASARPVRRLHDAISSGVYAAVRGGIGSAGRVLDAGLARRSAAAAGRSLSTRPRGAALIGVLDGLFGDALEREGSDLAEPLAIRVGGHVVPPRPDALAAAFPGARPRLVVFLHGLMETEGAWRWGARAGRAPYGELLERELPCTSIYVRYNSGRRISENGRSLAELLEELVSAWPVEVEQLALVGHSMGGLVARSACHLGAGPGAVWTRRVRHVVSLGTPHMGAPLEQAVHAGSAALTALPETRPLAELLRRRSGGIRDLRHGSLVDRDWKDRDPDALARVALREVPLLEGAAHCFVAATITRSPRHPLGWLLGDALVLAPSASGRARARRIPFRSEHGLQLGGTHHLALLNHPAVAEQLTSWLSTPPERIGEDSKRPVV